MKENNIDIPLVAIGGITNDDVTDLMKTGIDGIAISGSVLRAENPVETMYNLQLTVNSLSFVWRKTIGECGVKRNACRGVNDGSTDFQWRRFVL